MSFTTESLKENVEAVISHLQRIKPAAAKGTYLKRICLAASRTPSVTVAVG